MMIYKLAGRILKAAMLTLFLSVWMGCSLTPIIVMPESKVQKISAGESANFDGYLLTNSALIQLLEKAEKVCK